MCKIRGGKKYWSGAGRTRGTLKYQRRRGKTRWGTTTRSSIVNCVLLLFERGIRPRMDFEFLLCWKDVESKWRYTNYFSCKQWIATSELFSNREEEAWARKTLFGYFSQSVDLFFIRGGSWIDIFYKNSMLASWPKQQARDEQEDRVHSFACCKDPRRQESQIINRSWYS